MFKHWYSTARDCLAAVSLVGRLLTRAALYQPFDRRSHWSANNLQPRLKKRIAMKTARLLALLLLALLFVFEAGFAVNHSRSSARQDGGFTLEQILSSPFPSDLVASPIGERVAWVFGAQGKRKLWVAEARGIQASTGNQ